MLLVLRRRFILAAMGSLLAVLLALLAAFNIANYVKIDRRINHTLHQIAENGGKLPKKPAGSGQKPADSASAEENYTTRYFVVSGDQTLEEQTLNLENVATVTDDEAQAYLQEVLASGRKYGFCGTGWSYKYYVASSDKDNYMVVFVYCYSKLESFRSALRISLLAGLGSYLIVFLLVFLLSKRIVKPFLVSMERQKQFITDASHEIKTPLGIISANNDVVALECGESEWTRSSAHQIRRLNSLVESMIVLTRLDEERPLPAPEPFDAAVTVQDVVTDFEAPALLAGKSFLTQAEPPLACLGDEAALRQLAVILVDNAVKYSPEGGVIRVCLSRCRRGLRLEVSNPCRPMDRETLSRLFDRFYRADSSRKSGGCGIGLSIAKRLAENHGWKLTALSPEPGEILFRAEL